MAADELLAQGDDGDDDVQYDVGMIVDVQSLDEELREVDVDWKSEVSMPNRKVQFHQGISAPTPRSPPQASQNIPDYLLPMLGTLVPLFQSSLHRQ